MTKSSRDIQLSETVLLLGTYPQIPFGNNPKGTGKGLQQSCSAGSSLLQQTV